MALEIKLTQKLSQSLLMTPQLQQAIKLLQLGRLEYKEAIEQEMLENPVLEELPNEETSKKNQENEAESAISTEEAFNKKEDTAVDWEDYLNQFADSHGTALPKGSLDNEDRPSLEATLSKSMNLSEHLLSQMRFADLSEEQKPIVLHIIGNLDSSGFLCVSDEEIATACNCKPAEVAHVVSIVQQLEPVGVAARNLPDCLLIQLDRLGYGSSLAATIVKTYLKELENRKYDQIAKKEGVANEKVYEAIKLIRTLEPRPAKEFAEDETRYVTPDVYVYKDNGEYVISLNEDGLPKLRVSPYYLKVLQSRDDNSGDGAVNKQYLTERLKAASWLIKSIHQRQQTIYRVTESIVKFQQDFLDQGVQALKPLVLKEVADDIGMHESTVSRVTTNKFVHTPQGVFELKFFFSTGIQIGDSAVSSNSIKEKIKNIIAEENPKKPVSDQYIVDTLAAENVKIARRTVAKYRESMGILSSSKRKKYF